MAGVVVVVLFASLALAAKWGSTQTVVAHNTTATAQNANAIATTNTAVTKMQEDVAYISGSIRAFLGEPEIARHKGAGD